MYVVTSLLSHFYIICSYMFTHTEKLSLSCSSKQYSNKPYSIIIIMHNKRNRNVGNVGINLISAWLKYNYNNNLTYSLIIFYLKATKY